MARLLRQQYDNQPSGQMVSGWYVPNTGNAILGALANVIGGYQEGEASKEAKGIERERSQALAQALGSAGIAPPQTLLQQAGTPEEKPGFLDKTVSFLRGEQAPTKPAMPYQVNVAQNVSPEQRDAGLMSLYQIDPTMAAPMVAHEQFKLQKEQAADLKREALQARREEMQQQIQARQDIADQNNQLRLQMAQIAAGNKQAPAPVQIIGQNGEPMYVTPQQAIGQKPYNASLEQRTTALDQKSVENASKDMQTLEETAAKLNELKQASSTLSQHKGLEGISGVSGYLPSLPAGEAAQAQNAKEALDAKMTALGKVASAASGAIGSMATQEWKILKDQVDVIDPVKLGAKGTQQKLKELNQYADTTLSRLTNQYEREHAPAIARFPDRLTPRLNISNQNDPFAGFTPEQKAQYLKEHPNAGY